MRDKNIQMLLIVAIVAVGLSALCLYYLIFSDGGLSVPQASGEVEGEMEEEITTPLATSNIGDIVNALMKELLDEKMLLLEEEDDINLIISDDEEIKGFDQSINEDEL